MVVLLILDSERAGVQSPYQDVLREVLSSYDVETISIDLLEWPGEQPLTYHPKTDAVSLDVSLTVDDVTGAFVSPPQLFRPRLSRFREALNSSFRETNSQLREYRSLVTSLLRIFENNGARVVPSTGAYRLQERKPWQTYQFATSQFQVPDTLFTNDAAAAAEFVDAHDRVVAKPVSYGARPEPVTAEDLRSADEQLAGTPLQLQEFIPGTDHRLFVVDGECVCTARIESDNVSYARGYDAVETVTPPDPVAESAVTLAEQNSPGYATLDTVKHDGEWYVLEVNEGGGFALLGDTVTETVASALARYLADK